MPLVRIDAPHATPERLTALGDAIHNALVSAFAVPADDHFQIQRGSSHDRVIYDQRYLGVNRDDDLAIVQIFLRSGRDEQQKRAFYRAAADNASVAGIDARNLLIVLTENTLADWSFGNGVAHYLDNPPQPATTAAS